MNGKKPRYKCGILIQRRNNISGEQDAIPEKELTNPQAAKGIQKILSDAIQLLTDSHVGVAKLTLPKQYVQKFDTDKLFDNTNTTCNTRIYKLDDRHIKEVFKLELVNENCGLHYEDTELYSMYSRDIKRIRYMMTVESQTSYTSTLAQSSNLFANWNFNDMVDDNLEKPAEMLFECNAVMRSFGPDVGDLPSVHLNYGPGDKIWYSIKDDDQFKIAAALKDLNLANCESPLEHGDTVLAVDFLKNCGATVYETYQRPGDMVIVKPGTFYQHMSIGKTISERKFFYALGFEERVIRHKLCNCPERVTKTAVKDFTTENILINGMLDCIERALYGKPDEEYEVPVEAIPRDDDDVDASASSPVTESLATPDPTQQQQRTRTPLNRPGQPTKSQEDLHAEYKNDDAKRASAIPHGGKKRKLKTSQDADAGGSKKVKTFNKATAIKKIATELKRSHPANCECANCLAKKRDDVGSVVSQEDDLNEENVEEKNDQSASLRSTSPTRPEIEAASSAVRVPVYKSHPEMVNDVLVRRLHYFKNYFAPRSVETKRKYAAKRKTPTVHTNPKGLTTWFTNNISTTRQKYRELELLRQKHFDEGNVIGFKEDEFEDLKEKKYVLEEMRNAYRILKNLFCLDHVTLESLIASGYTVMGIFRDFIDGTSNGIYGNIYKNAVENALKSYDKEAIPGWLELGQCKKLWCRKFGVDKRYNIPWQKWKLDEPSITLNENFSMSSQEEIEQISDECLCDNCGHRVECDCKDCTTKRTSGSADIFANHMNVNSLSTKNSGTQESDKKQLKRKRNRIQSPEEEPTATGSSGAKEDSSQSSDIELKGSSQKMTQSQKKSDGHQVQDSDSYNTTTPNYNYDTDELPNYILEKIDDIRRAQSDLGFCFTKNNNAPIDRKFNDIAQLNLDQLQDGKYVGNEIIDRYIDLINRNVNSPAAIIVNSLFVEREEITVQEHKDIAELLDDRKWFMAPIFDADHWWLFVLNIYDKEYFIYDGLNRRETDNVKQKVKKLLNTICSCYLYLNVSTQYYATQIAQPSNFPLQPNNYDCAIFLLQVIRQLNAGYEEIQVFVPFCRELILSELLQDSLFFE